jgi:cytochrome d ubiquinol oxidase subunit I
MFSQLDPVFLARAQFAFTVAYHITFPAFTIGLASWLAVVEWRWLKTGNPLYEQIYRMWVKIFAVTFGMGVVTGVVLSYQFGTNWSVFADQVGNVLGPLCRHGDRGGGHPDFGFLDPFGQQLDADAGRLP